MPSGESEARAKTKARFDEVLKKYTNPPPEKRKTKKKSVQQDESIALETLKETLALNKGTDDDRTVLRNTYQPEDSSPRYIKNKLREKEQSEKVNKSSAVQEDSRPPKTRKKDRRELPKPLYDDGVTHRFTLTSDDGTWHAQAATSKASLEAVGGRQEEGRTQRKGRRKGGDTGREEVEAGDDLIHEYQQQIARDEERATKQGPDEKAALKTTDVIQQVVLNNDTGKKKKKKLRSHDIEVDSGSFQGSQPEDVTRKQRTKPRVVSLDTEEEELREEAPNVDEHMMKKKKKKTQAVVKEDRELEKEGPSRRMFDDSLVLGVYIHRTDQLKTDLLVSHPMVKVHVVDEVTGLHVKKEDSRRAVSSFYEQEKVEHILPIMSQPFDFKKNKSTIPEWEELIMFNERFGYFLQDDDEAPKVILFFEVLDFMSVDEARVNMEVVGHERGFRKVAWAFLKLVGTNGVLNVDSKLRLQLYCPPPRARKQANTIEVVEWWRRYPRNRYASTLYITVKGLKPPEHVDPSIRSMMALQQERGSTSLGELGGETSRSASGPVRSHQADMVKWSRVPGQVCRIPNKPLLCFRGGHMGCFKLRFSHDGQRLVAACADRDAFPIVVYEIPSGNVLVVFNGHLSIVYDVSWSKDDQSLLSASSDGTVRVWDVERLQFVAKKVLPHPSFVYSAQYHPVAQNIVVTGGYNSVVRVWNINVRDVNGQLLQEFEGHKTFINVLCFDLEGFRLFSGDNAGVIIVWNVPVRDEWRPTQLWSIEREIAERDLKGIAINALEVHPNGRRLLIHAKDSVVRVMDLRILAVKKYTGATNYRDRLSSTFTPCGSFIFSGSEDGMAYVWNAETGDRVAVYSELCYPTPLRDVAFHPHENMVAFCAFGESQPVHVYIYDHKVAQMEVENLKGDANTLKNASDKAPVLDSAVAAVDRFASTARVSLKMQQVKQKLDSVLNSPRNSSFVDYFYEQGGVSSTERELPHDLPFNTVHSDLLLPAPSLLSPHSKLHLSGAPHLSPPPLASTNRGFSPVGHHHFSRAPSLKLKVSSDDQMSSSIRVEADSFTPVQQMVVSLYDYRASRSDELTVCRGDVIQVLYKDNENWWFGCLANRQQGYFPANYVIDQRDLEEELSQAVEMDHAPSRHFESRDRSTPTKVMATINKSGELRFISEQDTDLEVPVRLVQKKKKKKKKRVSSPALSDADAPSTSQGMRVTGRPLPNREQTE